MGALWIVLCSFGASFAAAQGPLVVPKTAPATVEALMAFFAKSRGVRARFDEAKTMSILARDITTHGVLYFDPPDRLARVTTDPGASTVIVRGTAVSVEDETGRRELDLGASALARGLVGNLALLLRGDLVELETRHRVEYVAEGDRWRLDLLPRDAELAAIVDRVRVTGVGGSIASVETHEKSGDQTVTRLSDVAFGLEFTGAGERFFESYEPR